MDDFNMNEKYPILQYTHIHNAGIAGFFLFALTYTDSSTSIVSDFFLHRLHKNNYRGSMIPSKNRAETQIKQARLMSLLGTVPLILQSHSLTWTWLCITDFQLFCISFTVSPPVQVLDLRRTPAPQLHRSHSFSRITVSPGIPLRPG